MLSITIEICSDIKTRCEVGQSTIIIPFQMVKVKFIHQMIMPTHANNKWLHGIDNKGGESLPSVSQVILHWIKDLAFPEIY